MAKRTPRQHSYEVFSTGESGVSVTLGDTFELDAYGRQRISNPTTIFENSFEYDLQPLFWNTSVTGGADLVHDADKHTAIMTVSGSTAGTLVLQSLAYNPYQKGLSQRVVATVAFGARAAGLIRRVGYFDASDGVFLEQTSAGLFFVLRSSTSGSVVDTRYAQDDWSQNSFNGGGDKDGGENAFTLDETKRQILDMDIEWPAGRIRFGFNYNGKTTFAHYVNNINTGIAAAYMRTATLPVRYEFENDGTAGAAEFVAMAAAVFTEGGYERARGIPFSASRGVVAASVAARVPVLSIRPKATFKGSVNRVEITPIFLSVFTQTQSVLVEVLFNPLLFGTGSFVSVDDDSATEFNNSFTAASGGFAIQSFYVSTLGQGGSARGAGDSPLTEHLPLTLDIDGNNPEPLTIMCTPLTGTAAVYAAIDWDEVR